jgi:hypothetical protein
MRRPIAQDQSEPSHHSPLPNKNSEITPIFVKMYKIRKNRLKTGKNTHFSRTFLCTCPDWL